MKGSSAAQRKREPLGETQRQCPICDSTHLEYEFVVDRSPVCACQACGLLFLNPQPRRSVEADTVAQVDTDALTSIYQANAVHRLDELVRYAGIQTGSLLLIGADGHLKTEAGKRGFAVHALSAREFERDSDTPQSQSFDACVLFCAMEKMRDPLSALQTVRSQLVPGGSLLIISPTTDSKAARLLRNSWWEFNAGNLFYFSTDTLQNLLSKTGFGDPIICADRTL